MAGDPTNLKEFEEVARQCLPKMFYDFFKGGAEDEFTLRENVDAFQRIRINPRVLIDVSNINMSTSFLGFNLSAPILIAPTSGHKLAHPQGEVATTRAAAACNTIMVQSFSSNCTIEEVASSCNALRFFQLYVYKRRDISALLVQRAENCGFKAIVLTVDTPRIGRREADIKNKMIAIESSNLDGLLSYDAISARDGGSKLETFANETMDPSLSWKVRVNKIKEIIMPNFKILEMLSLLHVGMSAVWRPGLSASFMHLSANMSVLFTLHCFLWLNGCTSRQTSSFKIFFDL